MVDYRFKLSVRLLRISSISLSVRSSCFQDTFTPSFSYLGIRWIWKWLTVWPATGPLFWSTFMFSNLKVSFMTGAIFAASVKSLPAKAGSISNILTFVGRKSVQYHLAFIVFVNSCGRYLTGNYFAEYAVAHLFCLLFGSVLYIKKYTTTVFFYQEQYSTDKAYYKTD